MYQALISVALTIVFSACSVAEAPKEKETGRKVLAYVLIPPNTCLEVDMHVYEREMRFAPSDVRRRCEATFGSSKFLSPVTR